MGTFSGRHFPRGIILWTVGGTAATEGVRKFVCEALI